MSDFTDALASDASDVFLHDDEFAEQVTLTNPNDGTTSTITVVPSGSFPDRNDERKTFYAASGDVTSAQPGWSITWDGVEWFIDKHVTTDDHGIATLEVVRPRKGL